MTTLDDTRPMPGAPEAGQIVRVRQRQYFVEEVVPRAAGDDATLVRLSCVDETPRRSGWRCCGNGESTRKSSPAKPGRPSPGGASTRPSGFAAYLNTLRWNCVTATDPRLFHPSRAASGWSAYQLKPLRKALAPAAGQPVHCRRRGAGQDDRGPAHQPRVADPQEGPRGRPIMLSALDAVPVRERANRAVSA